jgi:hypothetical protein
MPRKKRPRFIEFRKPRFNRSDVKVLKNAGFKNNYHGPIAIDKSTKWKKISEDTFYYLVDKGAFTKEKISEYLKSRDNELKEKRLASVKNKMKDKEDYALIVELSKINLSTAKGIAETRKLLKGKKNKAALLSEAQKLRG